MRRRAGLAALLALALGAGGGLAASAPAVAAPEDVSVTVAPADDGVLRPGSVLRLDVLLRNTGATAVPAGRLRIAVDSAPPASVAGLVEGLGSRRIAMYLLAAQDVPALAAGTSRTVRVTVPADELQGVVGPTPGARLLSASLDAQGVGTVTTDTAVTWVPGSFTQRVALASVVPLTAPATTTGLVDPAALASLTGPDGTWTAALAAAREQPDAAVALDPAVLASVRAAGDTAPESATAFLEDLAALPNEFLELPYADGDVALTRGGGADAVLAPITFAGDLSPRPAPTPSPTVPPSPSPATPTVAPTAAVPDAEALLEWDYTEDRIAWPVDGVANNPDLAFLEQSGYDATLLSTAGVKDTAARVAAGPLARVGDRRVLVADGTVNGLLARAASGGGPAARAARSELLAVLATNAVTGDARTLLATAPRQLAAAPALDRALAALGEQDFVDPVPVSDLLDQQQAPEVGLRVAKTAGPRATQAGRLLEGEASVRALGEAAEDPATLVGPERLALLALLSSAWRGQDAAWRTAASAGERRFADAADEVYVVGTGSPITYAASTGAVTVTVVNELTTPVTVTLRGRPTNSRLKVTGTATRTVQPESQTTIGLPAEAITNGEVGLRVWLTGEDDATVLGPVVTRQLNVLAGWETVGFVVFVSGIALLFGIGLYRNIVLPRRRRRIAKERAAARAAAAAS